MKPYRILFFSSFLSLFSMFTSCPSVHAESCEKWIAKVVSAQGGVQELRSGTRQWLPVKTNQTYCSGDRIRVLARSRVDLLLFNETTLRLDQNTTITFSAPEAEGTSLIDLLLGAIHFFSRHRRSIRVVTPFVNATVEGTEFFMEVKADRTFLSVFDGQVSASNHAGEIRLTKGQSAIAMKEQPPVLQIVARPRDAIQWALYYPPVLSDHLPDLQPSSTAEGEALIQESIESYRKGDLEDALRVLFDAREESRNARFYTYRASLLLSVGRVDEARGDIERALQRTPAGSGALALQSVIAVVQNEKDKALGLARKAVEAGPRSAAARMALSYALQAGFDLEGALNSLKEAVRFEPENGLAWARLADLELSFGNLKEALKAAERASSLSPSLSRTQTVLGFAHLAQIKITSSKEAFERALRLDQADPLPRLGLGLAKIREGKLSEGREQIEIAASLDPDNSLIRSYLGKAFYEEKRDQLASSQFAAAKALDPMDPTPHFYGAILKQTMNRPVEALQDMQTSISLNDNRAVYRSRLLLDEDLASRSASLGRIYSDLGFQPLAVVEGWKSINADPSNFSAHRLLSDTYAALPRHEIARVSELLQSQLLQPINITPLQPHLSQSNLLLLGGGGPSTPSFNEFNPLFTRDRITLQLSGLGGENSTLADEAILAGIWGPVSYSAGQFYYKTDGFRKNNDLTQRIYNLFVQASLTPQTSVLGEFQWNGTDFGDLSLRYFPNDFLNEHTRARTYGARFGFRQNISPGSDLIGCFTYQNGDSKIHDKELLTLGGILGVKDLEQSYSGELQYLFRSEKVNLVAGAGYFSINRNTESRFYIPGVLPPFLLSSEDPGIRHTNLYIYGYLNFLKNLTVTVGASGDSFQGGIKDENQFNPKFGVTWNPFASTTLRGAIFRTFNRTLINRQTIEPTQVAGFNQFFDDLEATDAWNLGVAVDQKVLNNLFAGAEFSGRNLNVPFVDTDLGTGKSKVSGADWKERSVRAYLLWAPHPWFALSGEYLYEKLDHEDDLLAGISNATTQRLPVAVSFFHPSGLSAFVKASYVKQKGDFQPARYSPGTTFEGEDRFWVLDAAISYRLPKRYGFLTVGARNLLDRTFRYQDTDYKNPLFQPGRLIYGKVTLSF